MNKVINRMKDKAGVVIMAMQNFLKMTKESVWLLLFFAFGILAGGAFDGGLSIPVFVTFEILALLCLIIAKRKMERSSDETTEDEET